MESMTVENRNDTIDMGPFKVSVVAESPEPYIATLKVSQTDGFGKTRVINVKLVASDLTAIAALCNRVASEIEAEG